MASREHILPIEWASKIQTGPNKVTLFNARFLKDFGCFKEGSIHSDLSIDYEKGIVTSPGSDCVARIEFIITISENE